MISLNVNPDGVITKNKIGFFSENYKTMMKNVKTLIEDPELRQEMGSRAQAYAFENHTEKNIHKLIRLLDE